MARSESQIDAPWRRYWGKASRDDSRSCHLLAYHCLDVAAVAEAWLGADPALLAAFARASCCDEASVRPWVLIFVALHDLGKFDVRFQLKVPDIACRLNPGLQGRADVSQTRGFSHSDAGYAWFLREIADYGLGGVDVYEMLPWIRAVFSHHGQAPRTDTIEPPLADRSVIEGDCAARREWVAAVCELFLASAGTEVANRPPSCPNLLSGFCSVCDWVGSNSEDGHFPFTGDVPAQDIAVYFEERHAAARRGLAAGGMFASAMESGGMATLFPELKPRNLQAQVDQWPLEPGLTLVEAPTGSGKTEAALAHASRLLASGLADGIVFALPTQATANAMLDRVDKVAARLFPSGANLVLAHGKARFNPMFKNMVATARRQEPTDSENGVAQCTGWLAESRKRVFLGQIGVCTIDQVLLSVLPVRHYFVRGFGLRRNVLIVDEVHAYDRYMNTLLDRVLEAQRDAGGSAILLSATLPSRRRREILVQWAGSGVSEPAATDYPLVSFASRELREQKSAMTSTAPERDVVVRVVEADAMEPPVDLLAEVRARAEAGARVAVVCNLVDVAQGLRRVLGESAGVPVDLFHARFRFADRQQIEAAVLRNYGRDRQAGPPGRILIATQVVEQSLDLDFDWLVTQLCPVDLLFQRIGRMHRHERARPQCAAMPECAVLLPPTPDYGKHLAIYDDPLVLWRTEQLLRRQGSIRFPKAYRDWIEAVYADHPWPAEPEAVRKGHEESYVRELVCRSKALQMAVPDVMIDLWKDTDDNAARLTRDGETSLNVVPVLIHNGERRFLGTDTPLSGVDEWELAEQLGLQAVPVPHSWKKLLPNPEQGVYYLPVKLVAGGMWRGEHRGTAFGYRLDFGLWRE